MNPKARQVTCLIRPYSLVVKTPQPLRTEKECLEALKTMESEKTPGTDGFPAEFYKVFWNDISSTLINALNAEPVSEVKQ